MPYINAEALKTNMPAGYLSSSTMPGIPSGVSSINRSRGGSAVVYFAVGAVLVVATAILRGQAIGEWGLLNPDEAGFMASARAARLSPVPWSTWETGTTGPYLTLFLAGLGALGAPLTLAFAHLLSAILLALTAFALFVAASRAIGRGPALVATVVWWFPIAMTWLVGVPIDFSQLSSEYLPALLVVGSALVPREQLAVRPWLFAVLGMLAGVAVGVKYQVAPLAVAFAAAQLIVLRPSARRTVSSVAWWLAGAVLPVAAVALVMVVSPTTDWTLVEQNLSTLVSYVSDRSQMQPGAQTGRVEATFAMLIGPGYFGNFGPGYYLLVLLAGLIWLSRHSENRSNVARFVLIASAFAAMLAGGMGAAHYLIFLFAAAALAATMPIKPGARLFPRRLSPTLRARALAVVAAVVLVCVLIYSFDRLRFVVPLSPRQAAAAFSADSVNRDPVLARACPPGSRAMVWGYASEVYVAQDWESTLPYLNVGTLSMGGNRKSGEPLVRAGIDRAQCILDATLMKRPICPDERPEQLGWCLPAKFSLPRFYPELIPLVAAQFHTVPATGSCEGCTLYVRNISS